MCARIHPSLALLAAAVLSFTACRSETAQPAAESPQPAAEAPKAAETTGDFGVPECDNYVKAYLACLDRMPEAARKPARDAFEQSRTAWKQAASTDQGRAALAMTCKTAYDTAAPAMKAQGCPW